MPHTSDTVISIREWTVSEPPFSPSLSSSILLLHWTVCSHIENIWCSSAAKGHAIQPLYMAHPNWPSQRVPETTHVRPGRIDVKSARQDVCCKCKCKCKQSFVLRPPTGLQWPTGHCRPYRPTMACHNNRPLWQVIYCGLKLKAHISPITNLPGTLWVAGASTLCTRLSRWLSGLGYWIGHSACWPDGLMALAGMGSNPGLEGSFSAWLD